MMEDENNRYTASCIIGDELKIGFEETFAALMQGLNTVFIQTKDGRRIPLHDVSMSVCVLKAKHKSKSLKRRKSVKWKRKNRKLIK